MTELSEKAGEPIPSAAPEGIKGTRGRRITPADRRERILDAAQKLLQHGTADPTVADVARAAGVSRNLIYTYFKGAEAVIAALAEREKRLMTERLDAAEAPGSTAAAGPVRRESSDLRARRLIDAWLVTFEGHAGTLRTLTNTDAPAARALREMQGMLGARLARVFEPDPTETMVEELTGFTDFVLRFVRDAGGTLCPDAVKLCVEVCRDTVQRAHRKEDLLRFRMRRVARNPRPAAEDGEAQETHLSPGC